MAWTTTSPAAPWPTTPVSPPFLSPVGRPPLPTSSSTPPTSPSPWIANTGGRAPRESSRCERARVAILAVRNAILAARTPPAPQDDAPAATTSAAAHAVDHPGGDAVLTVAQRAAAVHVHQQAAMPDVYFGGRTTDPATWLRTPEHLAWLAAITRAANARRRAIEDGQSPGTNPGRPVDRHRQPRAAAPAARPGPRPGRPAVTARAGPPG
ncbi:hypothetical protein ACWGH7_37160 [Streptomyces cyaneofuscatus]